MENLKRVIGDAPSEMPFEEFVERLQGERNRVVEEMNYFRAGPTKEVKGIKPKGILKEVKDLMKKHGVTPEEFQKRIQAEVRKREQDVNS